VALLGYLLLAALVAGAATMVAVVGAALAGIGVVLFVLAFIAYAIWDWFKN
jgi:hypothetical protein